MRRHRTQWVRQWLLRRPMYGQYEKLMHELTTEDQTSFKNFLWVDPDIFMELLHRVGPRTEKKRCKEIQRSVLSIRTLSILCPYCLRRHPYSPRHLRTLCVLSTAYHVFPYCIRTVSVVFAKTRRRSAP